MVRRLGFDALALGQGASGKARPRQPAGPGDGSTLVRGGERVGLLGADRPPAMGRATLTRLAAELMAQTAGAGIPAAQLPRWGHAVLISDFLMPAETLAAALAEWAGGGVRGHLVHLLDPAEESLPYQGRTHFYGLEGEGDMLAPRAETLRDKYQARLIEHRAALAAAARAWGWGFTVHHTDQPPNRRCWRCIRRWRDGKTSVRYPNLAFTLSRLSTPPIGPSAARVGAPPKMRLATQITVS